MFFVVLVAHTNQSGHPDYGSDWLTEMVDVILSYDNSTFGSEKDGKRWGKGWGKGEKGRKEKETQWSIAQEMEDQGIHEVKSKFDYSIVLERCLSSGAEYVLMVEDDIVFAKGWWRRVRKGVGEIVVEEEEMRNEGGCEYFPPLFFCCHTALPLLI